MRDKPPFGKFDMAPRYQGAFVSRSLEHYAGEEAVPEREVGAGRWCLINGMTKASRLDKAGFRRTNPLRDNGASEAVSAAGVI